MSDDFDLVDDGWLATAIVLDEQRSPESPRPNPGCHPVLLTISLLVGTIITILFYFP